MTDLNMNDPKIELELARRGAANWYADSTSSLDLMMSRIQKTRDKLETLGDDPEAALAIMMAISELMDEFHVASGKLNVAFGIDTVARLAQSHARVQAA